MDRLWAPWREKLFIKKSKKCLFCEMINSRANPDKNLVVYKGKLSYALLNKYPYNAGHVMVAPYRHIPDFDNLSGEEVMDVFHTMRMLIKAIKRTFKPDGFNVGVNIGKVAGAGVEKHLHIHIVPRWIGDTNFMPIFSDTKVISQALRVTSKKLKKCLRHEV